MDTPVTVALAQTNPATGDLDANAATVVEWCDQAAAAGADLVLFPELALTGYGADDLFSRGDFLRASMRTLEQVAERIRGTTALVGFPELVSDRGSGTSPVAPLAANSIAALADGEIRGVYRKRHLSRAGGVDQPGRFVAGTAPFGFGLGEHDVALLGGGEYRSPLVPGAGLIAVAGAFPYVRGGKRGREEELRRLATEQTAWVACTDFGGGQDELIFQGASALISPDGGVVARAGQFAGELLVATSGIGIREEPGDLEELYMALVAGTRDFIVKNGFGRVGLGLSGGLDSALTAALAVDAIGADRVSLVIMPSRHSSEETQSDARRFAADLGCELIELPIEGPLAAFQALLGRDSAGLAEENLQARIRGSLLMALANSRGWLVLATGNKSESAVGYSTLYGDMVGGFDPIQDVSKTVAFKLCRYRNGISPVIPESIIERPPSAELRPGQKDSDALPEYDVLDRILERYIEAGQSAAEIVASGESPETVAEVISLVDRSEYKRRQAPPGLKVSPVSFTRDRRMPLTGRFSGEPTDSRDSAV
ncbi:MAG: NAD+ synthase [Solirubrobacterales bacterium]|nr:NAD+ synthase [Solirubrobacterales bacterium]